MILRGLENYIEDYNGTTADIAVTRDIRNVSGL